MRARRPNSSRRSVRGGTDERASRSESAKILEDRELMDEIERGLRELERGGELYTLEELLPED